MKYWPRISGRGGGKHITSVKEFYEKEVKTPQGHCAVLSLKAFDRIFSNKNNSIVINMEDLKEDELGKAVACSLPNTPHSCDFFTNEYKHETKVNAVNNDKKGKERMDIEFHRMAQESHWKNLVPTTYERNQTFHLIKSFWSQNFTTDDFYDLYQQESSQVKKEGE